MTAAFIHSAADAVILAVVVLLVAGGIAFALRRRRQGKSACSSCARYGACGRDEKTGCDGCRPNGGGNGDGPP